MITDVTLCVTSIIIIIGGDCSWCSSNLGDRNNNCKLERVMSKMSGVLMTAAKATSSEAATNLISTEFEVFGKVQGVFFRKYTKAKGADLGLRGWVQNTPKGTVVGQLEGTRDRVSEMKRWLQSEGSPKSRISKAEFRNEQNIEKYNFIDFNIRK